MFNMLNNAEANANNNMFNLTIYQKYLELIYYTNDVIKKFPATQNIALAQKIKSTVYGGLRLLMYSTKAYTAQEKLTYLNEFVISLNMLKAPIKL